MLCVVATVGGTECDESLLFCLRTEDALSPLSLLVPRLLSFLFASLCVPTWLCFKSSSPSLLLLLLFLLYFYSSYFFFYFFLSSLSSSFSSWSPFLPPLLPFSSSSPSYCSPPLLLVLLFLSYPFVIFFSSSLSSSHLHSIFHFEHRKLTPSLKFNHVI